MIEPNIFHKSRLKDIIPYIFINFLSAVSENEEIRDVAIKSTVKIYTRCSESTRNVIEKNALLYLGFITLPNPPPELSAFHNLIELYNGCGIRQYGRERI